MAEAGPPRRPGDPRADRVRERFAALFGRPELPVPVEGIAEDLLGLIVTAGPLPVSGLLIVPRREVWLNEAEPAPRRRFTLAHEIAHWVCHRERGARRCALTGDEADSDPLEREANTFAAELLMPADLVRAAHASGEPVERLALRFDVSPEAMGWRLYNLALGPLPAPRPA